LRSLIAIDFVWNKRLLIDHDERAVGRELAEETTAIAFVANTGAKWFDQQEERIRVAIETDFAKPEHMTAGFPFFPEAIAGAREKVDLPGKLGLSQSGCIEVTEHQHFTSAMVLNNARNETTKFFKRQFQESLPKTKIPLAVRASGLNRALIR
jgi:hypothetical protein